MRMPVTTQYWPVASYRSNVVQIEMVPSEVSHVLLPRHVLHLLQLLLVIFQLELIYIHQTTD
jgi:hypothetical protein